MRARRSAVVMGPGARRRWTGFAVMVLLTLGWTAPGSPQSSRDLDGLAKEVDALKASQAAIVKELQELQSRLGRRAPARPAMPRRGVVLNLDGAASLGDERAPVVLIEFLDYQCPFCARHVRDMFPQIEQEYIRTGKVRYLLRDFPLESSHPQAFKSHEAARCAGDQGKRWEMHARLLTNQEALTPPDLVEHARAIGLEMAKFQQCLESGTHAAEIRRDIEDAARSGVRGTPSFFLGLTQPGASKLQALWMFTGSQPYQRFKAEIDFLLTLISDRPD